MYTHGGSCGVFEKDRRIAFEAGFEYDDLTPREKEMLEAHSQSCLRQMLSAVEQMPNARGLWQRELITYSKLSFSVASIGDVRYPTAWCWPITYAHAHSWTKHNRRVSLSQGWPIKIRVAVNAKAASAEERVLDIIAGDETAWQIIYKSVKLTNMAEALMFSAGCIMNWWCVQKRNDEEKGAFAKVLAGAMGLEWLYSWRKAVVNDQKGGPAV